MPQHKKGNCFIVASTHSDLQALKVMHGGTERSSTIRPTKLISKSRKNPRRRSSVRSDSLLFIGIGAQIGQKRMRNCLCSLFQQESLAVRCILDAERNRTRVLDQNSEVRFVPAENAADGIRDAALQG
jgi:hypothetical protein